jgi:hypothetical protein
MCACMLDNEVRTLFPGASQRFLPANLTVGAASLSQYALHRLLAVLVLLLHASA